MRQEVGEGTWGFCPSLGVPSPLLGNLLMFSQLEGSSAPVVLWRRHDSGTVGYITGHGRSTELSAPVSSRVVGEQHWKF